ncbi:ribosomal RNA-processing protein 12 [Cristinia sonorae]|uniref:Ribosomal RNA-processing protein 12 n=1 Tax=Cristinia sonorae TaxID=1940300 RepID=A0A8K0UXT2_9AGAR|nr:ribosomal RNA-processing protein 12 [Cristinia sonorae]
MSEGLETALSKIRPHTSSSLPHQKAPATLLHALEATFAEQDTQRVPTAYFAALLTTLDGTLQSARSSGPSLRDGDVLPAELYLLAIVTPHVPPAVIKSNLNTIISLTAPLFPTLVPHAPPLRSQLSFYEAVFRALDRPQLEVPGLRQSFESILHLALDPRPKVRKRAAELVNQVLSNPPPPSLRHPFAERVAAWLKETLGEIATGVPKFKGKNSDTEGLDSAIHLLSFLRPVLSQLPPSVLPSTTSSLLSLPRLGNPYLSQSAYSILSELLAIPIEDPTNNVRDRLPEVLDAVLSSRPPNSNTTLAPAWANLLGNAMSTYHEVDAEKTSAKVGEAWQALWNFLESTDPNIRKSAEKALALVGQCFTPTLIQAAVKESAKGERKSVIGKIISQTTKALESLAFARSIPDVLAVISSLLSNLRYRNGPRGTPTAAEKLLLPLIVKIAELRVQRTFEFKEAADATLSRAMGVLGPEVMLRSLPLNLDSVDRQAGREPRAFLLPMLSQPHPTPLSHFVSYFVPLTERMFDLQQTADIEGRQSEAKVWSVLVDQIWAGLYGYCYGGTDLKTALTPEFSQLLSQLLYSQPDLRPAVLKALRVLVESNDVIASGDPARIAKLPEVVRADSISQEAAQSNLVFLRTQVESWLAVLFNIFSSAGRNGQGMVGDVIAAWVAIADAEEVTKAYQKLIVLLRENVNKAPPAFGPKETESITAMTLDILIILLPHLSITDATALFEACLSSDLLESKDNGVQKRGYKILTKLVSVGKVDIDAADVLQRLEQTVDGLAPAAKKDRMSLLSSLVTLIPSSNLHLLPSIIPEAVLGTKEPSEKARNAAFDLIVAMGHKMSAGGTVKRDLVDGMDDDNIGETQANIEEYMTMVAGGLAGATPHMISATITAISRLVFEFKDSIPAQMHSEIFATLLVFLSSANREIVKSALGYVKLAIHTMPVDLLRPHLKQVVPALLSWSHDHKNHFKEKVRHIFERMLRRFGWEDIYTHAEQEEARKFLLNIKKRKERAKRKKNREADNEDAEDRPTAKAAGGDAFEDVLYGSESELDDSDDEGTTEQTSKRQGGTRGGAGLRVDDDDPMDLLSGAATHVTAANAKRRRKPGQDASRFKTDDDTGKMVIDESDEEAGGEEEDVAGAAYREAITSADGFTRGPNGKIKFNKDTKKRRHENMEEDVEMGDAEASSAAKGPKRKSAKTLGHEFKAKKAGGDVKKGGVDPYAYLPLSQAAKKKGRRERLGVAGKR